MPDVVVVGDADTDVFMLIPHIPTWDEGVLAQRVLERPGGKGANCAAALTRLGVAAGILACVGDDHYGQVAQNGLDQHGVDTSHLILVPGGSTYYCIMLLDPTGEKAIVVVKTDLIYPSPTQVEEHAAYLLSARHVHAVGLDPEKVAGALRMARRGGLSTSVDLDAAYGGLAGCRDLLADATIVFVNEQGAATLFGPLDAEEVIGRLLAMGPESVVVTRGRRGAVAGNANGIVAVPAFAVDVRDTTGSGDCFSGAFVFGHLQGWDLRQTLSFASAAAALSTSEIGGQAALPTAAVVNQFMRKRGI